MKIWRTLTIVLGLTAAGAAQAGDNNIIVLEQSSDRVGPANVLTIDQSAADNSRVGGSLSDPALPARQAGGANTASITLGGNRAAAALTQVNTALSPVASDINTATLIGGGFADLVLVQEGAGNTGLLTVGAGGNAGELQQFGRLNTGTVTVSGSDARGRLIQNGSGNTYSLEVDGVGTSVEFRQVGNNLSARTPVSVISNATSVTITQSQF